MEKTFDTGAKDWNISIKEYPCQTDPQWKVKCEFEHGIKYTVFYGDEKIEEFFNNELQCLSREERKDVFKNITETHRHIGYCMRVAIKVKQRKLNADEEKLSFLLS